MKAQLELLPIEVPQCPSLVNAVVREINNDTVRKVVMEEHYMGDLERRVVLAFGLYIADTIAGVVSYGLPMANAWKIVPPVKDDKSLVELVRLAIYRWAPKNAGSYFIGASLRAIRRMRPDWLVAIAYADPAFGHLGFVYQSSNWTYFGEQKGDNYRLVDDDGGIHRRKGIYLRYGTTDSRKLGMKSIALPKKLLYVIQLQKSKEVSMYIAQHSKPYPKVLS